MNDLRTRPLKVRDALASLQSASLDPVLCKLYAARGIESVTELDYTLSGLLPVSSLPGIDEAVELLLKHRQGNITIIGDFDADGATSTALVVRCLRAFGFADVSYLVPNRFEYGYGLTPEIVQVAARQSPDLLLTVDNGVSSLRGVAEAHSLGIQVLITDHHLPGKRLPDADVMVNPNVSPASFGSPHLAGVGVAFYLMAALGRQVEAAGVSGASKVPAQYLDLVALGTVADVVRLDRNNRILVSNGIQRIRAGRTVPGISALFAIAGRSQQRIVSTDLGFVAGPRLNAAGRLKDMSLGIECLLTDDPQTATRLAAELDTINRERKSIESKMRHEAFAYVDTLDARNLPACVCLYDASWHQGIVGLIASRVRERCDRPVIVFAKDADGMLKGSARSVSGVNIRDVLEAVSTAEPGLVKQFGGHAMAAGLSMPEQSLGRFSELSSERLSVLYPEADFSGAILTDGALAPVLLNLEFARLLRESGPWGAGFPEPTFSGEFHVDEQRTVGENHLKLRVRPASGGGVIEAIAFNQAGSAYRGVVQLAFRLDVNEYRGAESAQLVVEQIVNLAARP